MALIDNLISYWKLDESSWNAADSVGSNTLTNSNITYTTWKINNCAVFNWSTSKLYSSTTAIVWTWANTVNFWVNITTNPTAWNRQILYWLFDGIGSWKYNMSKIYYNNESWTLILRGANSNDATYQWNITQNLQWSWFMVTQTTTWLNWTNKFYINWTAGGSTWSIWNKSIDSSLWSWVFWLWVNNTTNWVDGKIDEVWIWDRELSASEISQLYNSWNWLAYPFTTTSTFIPKITIF